MAAPEIKSAQSKAVTMDADVEKQMALIAAPIREVLNIPKPKPLSGADFRNPYSVSCTMKEGLSYKVAGLTTAAAQMAAIMASDLPPEEIIHWASLYRNTVEDRGAEGNIRNNNVTNRVDMDSFCHVDDTLVKWSNFKHIFMSGRVFRQLKFLHNAAIWISSYGASQEKYVNAFKELGMDKWNNRAVHYFGSAFRHGDGQDFMGSIFRKTELKDYVEKVKGILKEGPKQDEKTQTQEDGVIFLIRAFAPIAVDKDDKQGMTADEFAKAMKELAKVPGQQEFAKVLDAGFHFNKVTVAFKNVMKMAKQPAKNKKDFDEAVDLMRRSIDGLLTAFLEKIDANAMTGDQQEFLTTMKLACLQMLAALGMLQPPKVVRIPPPERPKPPAQPVDKQDNPFRYKQS
jgi:hypothetical protein